MNSCDQKGQDVASGGGGIQPDSPKPKIEPFFRISLSSGISGWMLDCKWGLWRKAKALAGLLLSWFLQCILNRNSWVEWATEILHCIFDPGGRKIWMKYFCPPNSSGKEDICGEKCHKGVVRPLPGLEITVDFMVQPNNLSPFLWIIAMTRFFLAKFKEKVRAHHPSKRFFD